MQPTPQQDFYLSVRQFIEAWHLYCAAAPAYSHDSAPGLECIFSGVPISFFNAAVLTGRDISADILLDRARTAQAWAESPAVPWLLVVTNEALQPGIDASAILLQCGLTPVVKLAGMLAENVSPAGPVPDELELAVPHNDSECEALLDVNSAAYATSFAAGQPVWGRQAFWRNHFPVVGLVDDHPVSCAACLNVDGYRYVAMVATLPDKQRRGYADAAMRHALQLARRKLGEQPTFLHATEAGRPVYERMGYRTIATHSMYMDSRFLV